MRKTLRKKFIFFAMTAVTVLLVVLIGAINGLSWVILDRQTDAILHELTKPAGSLLQNEPPGRPLFAPPMNLDTIKSARLFTVHMDNNGRILDINIDQISSVSEEMAEHYAGQVTDDSGKIDGYKYVVKQTGTDRWIFFMDTSNQINIFLMVLSISSGLALLCWLAVLLFVIPFSGRVVRPILAGAEKQKQFITNAGHELKTPLAIIQSNNDAMTLLHGETKYNRNIRHQTQRLNALMTNLLTLAKLDEEVKLPTEAVDISELIGSMLPVYEDAALDKQITLSVKIQPGILMQVHRDTFIQMISVLLDNAVKYTPEKGLIRFTVNCDSGYVWIVEENTCEIQGNMDPERLFERFYRGDDARTQSSAVSGYGIGLSAARVIAETFGGKLTADYPSAGTIRFTARFRFHK